MSLVVFAFIGAFILASSFSPWLILPIALLCVPAIFGFILLAVYLALASALAERFIVIKNLPIIESIDRAVHLTRDKLKTIVVAWLINLVINIVAGIASLILIVVPTVLFIILGIIAYSIGKVVGLIIVISIALIALIALSLFVQGFFVAYVSTYWTLVYRQLIKD